MYNAQIYYDIYSNLKANEFFIKNIKINFNKLSNSIEFYENNSIQIKYNSRDYSPKILLNLTLPATCESTYNAFDYYLYDSNDEIIVFTFDTKDFNAQDTQFTYKLYKSLICKNRHLTIRKRSILSHSLVNYTNVVYLWNQSLNKYQRTYSFKLNINTPIGSIIGKIDVPKLNMLECVLHSVNYDKDLFVLSSNELRLVRIIKQSSIFLAIIYIKNITNDLVVNKILIKIDVQEEGLARNELIFTENNYDFIVLLDSFKIGSQVGQINVFSQNLVEYSINDSRALPFDINTRNGSIYLKELVMENDFFEFKIRAQSNDQLAFSKVNFLIIKESYTGPKFTRKLFKFNISEDDVIGTQLGILQAITPHSPHNHHIEFQIQSGNAHNLFTLLKYDSNKVLIQLNGALSYKEQSTHELIIQVNDQNDFKSTCNVIIQVQPGNIHNPRFTKDFYSFTIYENVSLNALIGQIKAIDDDIGMNGLVRYKIIDNIDELLVEYHQNNEITRPSKIDFSLDEETGELRVTGEMDRERFDLVSLHVSAKDGGQPERVDQAMINIEILDVNDNYPLFLKSNYNLSVSEDAKLGTYLMRVEASDKDLGRNAMIRYAIKEKSPFSIDSLSGTIRVAFKLDRELVNLYNLTLIAYDLGTPSLSSSSELLIHVLDVNDNPPHFQSNELVFYLAENQPVGTIIANVTANDDDIGPNANIIYTLLDGFEYFELKPSNDLANTVTLVSKFTADYELKKNSYSFYVRAYSDTLFTDCLIQVLITDTNDNSPVLMNPFKIVFNNYRGSFTLDQYPRIPATDRDVNDTLTFKLVDSIGDKIVQLNEKDGRLVFKPILNANNFINLSFDVLVSDGLHKIQSTCNLIVLMVSENMLMNSVTLRLSSVKIEFFLDKMYDSLVNLMPKLIKEANILIFNIEQNNDDLLISLAVALNYDRDHFVDVTLLKQLIFPHLNTIAAKLGLALVELVENDACTLEPCLNYQTCSTQVTFKQALNSFYNSSYIQFRSIQSKTDFYCSCPSGFTGATHSFNCDLEINLCYSNPCGSNGVCMSLESNYYCLCDVGYSGKNCEFNLNTIKCTNETRMCKGQSACKNLILGGITCDNCNNKNHELNQFYNKFCELHTRHFPASKQAYLVFAGLRQRSRFTINLTFATIKKDSILLFNSQLNKRQQMSRDYIKVFIRNETLFVEFSLGDDNRTQLQLDSLKVSDGKWRTLSVDYRLGNVTLSLDNDDSQFTNACDLATTSNCFRVTKTHTLPDKCKNQIETCFRYFDLNGPLFVGRDYYTSDNSFEGCVNDLRIDGKMVDLSDDLLYEFNTQIGCTAKTNDVCKSSLMSKCKICSNVWNDKVKCECESDEYEESSYCTRTLDKNIFSLDGNGYVSTNDSSNAKFYIKTTEKHKNMTLLTVDIDSTLITLKYLHKNQKLLIISDSLPIRETNGRLINDGFWCKIEFSINTNEIALKINDLIEHKVDLIDVSSTKKIRWFIGGSPNDQQGFVGCLKELNRDSYELVNGQKGCRFKSKLKSLSQLCSPNPCFNNATCINYSNNHTFACECSLGFKGKYCEHTIVTSMRLIDRNTCPAKWWGKNGQICGPCECDERLNFSPDCNKTTGECMCKSKHYKIYNPIAKRNQCVPCDCYLEGSASLHCNPSSGQCVCLSGAGLTGRRCDQCISKVYEFMRTENECRLASSDECPKAHYANMWWSRTKYNSKANSTCPKGSVGFAYRECSSNDGWSHRVDLTQCRSFKLNKFKDDYMTNITNMTAFQVLRLVDELNKFMTESQIEDFLADSSSIFKLYPFDLLMIKNLTMKIIQFDISQAPSFLQIQDKNFIKNLFKLINFQLSNQYNSIWQELRDFNQMLNSDFLAQLNEYINNLLDHDDAQVTFKSSIDLSLENVQFFINSMPPNSIQPFVRFQVLYYDNSSTSEIFDRISYVTLKNADKSLPTRLLIQESTNKLLDNSNYYLATDVLILSLKKHHKRSSIVITEFTLNVNNSIFLNPKNIYCVTLNEKLNLWSTSGGELLAFDSTSNKVKCSFKHASLLSVMIPKHTIYSNVKPVPFNTFTYIFVVISLTLSSLTLFLLISLRRNGTTLSSIYSNLNLNILLMQCVYLVGVNLNGSHIACKLIAVVLHFLHLSSFIWILLQVLHLYRMLTELRDINKNGTRTPAVYYALAYVIPSIVTSLTFGIKQDIYTSWSSSPINYYCWLNIHSSTNDYYYVLILPICLTICLTICLLILSFKELLRKSFKQTDVQLVRQCILAILLVLPLQCMLMMSIFLVISSSYTQMFTLYETIYLSTSIVYSLSILFIVILMNKALKEKLKMFWMRLKQINDSSFNDSLNASNSQLCVKSPYVIKQQHEQKLQVHDVNTRYVIDYHENTNSMSTTTTNGTLENLNNLEGLIGASRNLNELGVSSGTSQCFTTTFSQTETTCDDESSSDLNYCLEYHNQPPQQIKVQSLKNDKRNSVDVVDVSKALYARPSFLNNLKTAILNKTSNETHSTLPTIHSPVSMEYKIKTGQVTSSNTNDINSDDLQVTQNDIEQVPVHMYWQHNNKASDYDSSFVLDASNAYSPSKTHLIPNSIPDILTCSATRNLLNNPPIASPKSLNYANTKRLQTFSIPYTTTILATDSDNNETRV